MNNVYKKAGRSVLASMFASALILTGCEKENFLKDTSAAQPQSTPNNTESLVIAKGMEYVPNQVLVKFRAGVSESARANALARVNGKAAEKILTKAMQNVGDNEGITVVNTPLAALEAVSRLKGGAEIEYAEPNYIYTHTATSNDTYFTGGQLWGMYGDATSPANQYGSQAGEAWAAGRTDASTVYIGIIDEGYMYTHEDLAANAGTNPGEGIQADGVDNDGNGYVDDIYGWDFDGINNTVYDGTQDDHGTHVAGTIGAVGGNGKGVAGVCWNVKLLNAKFLGSNGGTTANAIKAVDYFTNLKKKQGLNIVATNNSWGGGGFSQGLYDAIERANAAGILFIAAAGNGGMDGRGDNNDKTPHYPSSYTNSNIIAVASITSSGAKSGFSNYGATSVDIGAPGSGIWSTLPDNKYGSYNGTSMATPHVAGAVALYASVKPGSTAATIRNAILSSAIPTASLSKSNKTPVATGGRLDANAALSK